MEKYVPRIEDFQNIEIVILDYYDGPTSGALLSLARNTAYRIVMLDWDDNHNVRIFGLAPLSPANFEKLRPAGFKFCS